MYGRLRVNVEILRNFNVYAWPFTDGVYFIYALKFYAALHGNQPIRSFAIDLSALLIIIYIIYRFLFFNLILQLRLFAPIYFSFPVTYSFL